MEIVDAQLHDIGPNLAWPSADKETRFNVLTELMLGWMDAVGVDKALIHPRDQEWAARAVKAHPQRFAGVYKVADPEAADVAEQVANVCQLPAAVGLRLSFGKLPTDPSGEAGETKFKSGAFDAFFVACEKSGLPLFCSAYGYSRLVGEIARRHPALRLIVDHMGIAQPPLNPREDPPWKSLSDLIALADLRNVNVKMCGVPVLSNESFPFRDTESKVREILDAFGAERVMWASDIGRFAGRIGWDNAYPEAHAQYKGKHTYAEALFLIKVMTALTETERELLLGGTVRRLLGWPRE